MADGFVLDWALIFYCVCLLFVLLFWFVEFCFVLLGLVGVPFCILGVISVSCCLVYYICCAGFCMRFVTFLDISNYVFGLIG